MTERLLKVLSDRFNLSELDVKEFSSLSAKGMRFTVRAFKAEGLGHVSLMQAKGFFGLMRMDTIIINPLSLDLPLYSYDRIYAMGNDTLIVELYDTLLGEFSSSVIDGVKEKYSSLPERDPGEHWYDGIKLPSSVSKKAKKIDTPRFDLFAIEHLEAYFDSAVDLVHDHELKRKKSLLYVEGLLKNGGPSTDVFKKTLGEEKTARLFKEVLFGTQ